MVCIKFSCVYMKKKFSQILIFTVLFFIGGQSVFAQQKGSTTKSVLVKEIVDLTISVFPVSMHQRMYDKAKSDSPGFIKSQVKSSFPVVLSRQTNLSIAQKNTLTNKLPDLLAQLDAPINQIVANRFTGVNSLIAEYFQESLSKYSTAEILEISRFLKSKAGASYLKQLKQIAENMTAQKAKPLEIEEKYRRETGAFLASGIGTKYNQMFITDSGEAVFDKLKQTLTLLLEDFNKDAEVGRIMNGFLKSV